MVAYFVETQVVLPYTTNLPRDVAVNTFHFRADSATAPAVVATDIYDVLTALYNTTATGAAQPLRYYLSAMISRVTNACQIKSYNLSDPLPRAPFGLGIFTLGAPSATTSLPMEVSLCSSYRSAYLSGKPAASSRGRFYLGPLMTGAATTSANFPSTPTGGLQTDLAAATKQIITNCAAKTIDWVQFSRKLQAGDDAIAGWVDNEWDTQRRRQVKATSRVTWS